MKTLQHIGRIFLAFLATIGRLALFMGSAAFHCVRPPFYPRTVLRHMVEIGHFSLPVVGLTAIFAGMVLQSYTGFARFSAEGAIANVVVLSITRELGPVLAGLMVAGRIGASLAAEIDRSGNEYVEQFIHGRAEGPIKMAVRA
jgi:phospholipid/cholesterol/gamma-HCH transport system permease protein